MRPAQWQGAIVVRPDVVTAGALAYNPHGFWMRTEDMADITETVLDTGQTPEAFVAVLGALNEAPRQAAALTAALPAEAHDWRPTPEAWSARMLAAHLSSAEPLFLGRMQTILSDDNPFLPYFGPTVALPEAPSTLPDLLARFEQDRSALVRLLVDLPAAAWARPAVHETMGPTTLALQAQNIANHDAEHLAQLAEVARLFEEQQRHG